MNTQLDDLTASYINGNITYVKQQIKQNNVSFAELYDNYVNCVNPDKYDIWLFINRLTD